MPSIANPALPGISRLVGVALLVEVLRLVARSRDVVPRPVPPRVLLLHLSHDRILHPLTPGTHWCIPYHLTQGARN
eukprot:3911047-Alexandrium_andersonii.AAC.1